MKAKKLNGKDLIQIGIYAAIYFFIVMVIAMFGFIPIFMPLICVLAPILGGIPLMLFFTKVKKFGMILILSLLMGILMLITGMGYYSIIVGLISGLISEIIYRSGNYQSSAKAILAYAVFSVWMWGNFLPIFFNPTVYFSTRQDLGLEYAQTLISLLPSWMCPVLLIITFLCGLIGGVLGRSVLKKHFIKAGLV
ncbi:MULTISPECIES: MptD family putative ECF transporter S component [Enterococcus]|uniref:Integral membrane protein n=1 Tax=Candidatus Enterococcus ferrettii TaxID=2815324 RepID=A0ABV0EP40_9ENTE|nr:MptD family putative ECF transporter S component [Enterococcus sp. 665A]MBO1342903.1 MptD family putative ECF transporter S component [Enterococcus sp. 665A]